MNKKTLIVCLIITAVILAGCILDMSIISLGCVGLICAMILLADFSTATCLLFFFSPLSYILFFNQYNIYLFLAIAYVLAILRRNKGSTGAIFGLVLMGYCLIFADHTLNISIGDLIYPILLLLLMFACMYVPRSYYRAVVMFFVAGFIVSALIGLFVDQIPSIREVVSQDELYIAGVDTGDIQRYAGLSYDPNFFTLIDCILISTLLFSDKKIGLAKGIALLFLAVIGFFTFSKSYVLLLSIIFIFYILTNSKNPFKSVAVIAVCIIVLLIVENFTSIKVLSLINARFANADGTNDITTGRYSLWVEYINYILDNPWCFLFGDGFNALSLGKAVHNTYIDFIFRFGIVGSGLWFAYFAVCKRAVDKNKQGKTLNVSFIVLVLACFFLSTFYFQQIWCCMFLAFISPYVIEGKNDNDKIKCNSPGI